MIGAVSHISSGAVQVIIGVDTHKDQHVAVAIDMRGVRLDDRQIAQAHQTTGRKSQEAKTEEEDGKSHPGSHLLRLE